MVQEATIQLNAYQVFALFEHKAKLLKEKCDQYNASLKEHYCRLELDETWVEIIALVDSCHTFIFEMTVTGTAYGDHQLFQITVPFRYIHALRHYENILKRYSH